MYHFYSHLKHLIATAEQIAVIINIITIGIIIFSTDCPKIADFSIFIPCVSGNTSTMFFIIFGITSYGIVAPENISIGKYNTLAITPAIFESFDIPPTIIPILNIEIITSSHHKMKLKIFPCMLNLKKSLATKNNELIDTKEYRAYIVTSTSNITIGSTGVTLNRFKICLLL